MMLQTVRTQDYFWALGVGRDTPAADIDRAYEALARSFHADRYRLAPEEDRKAAAGDLRQARPRRTARCAIRRRRKSYLAKLTRAGDDARDEAAGRARRPRPRR